MLEISSQHNQNVNTDLQTIYRVEKGRENKDEFQMLLKKSAVCTWITPEENNEGISYI